MVGMMFSWHCPARCRHCAYHCGPQQGPVISAAQARSIIDAGRALPLTKSFCFVGGEAFVHRDLLRETSRYVKETCGYPFAITTNAFWAATEALAVEALGELAELGLRSLLVSVDDFHLEYIDHHRIENCVNAALAVGLECTLQSIVTKTSRRVADFKTLLAVPSDNPSLQWVDNPCVPTGRAEDPALADDLLLEWRNQPGLCTMLKLWLVDPQGEVSPCCGVPFNRLLRIGNAFEEPLAEIVHRANVNPLLNAIAAYGGPYILIDLLATRGVTTYSEQAFTSNCHACQTVLRDRQALELIRQDLEEHRLELLASRAIYHEQFFRDDTADGENLWLPEPWYKSTTA